MKHRLTAEILEVAELTIKQKEMMHALYANYYDGFDKVLFYQDLNEKHWAIVLFDDNNIIRGFTTIVVAEHLINHQSIRSVFSGDTIIHHDFWGEQALPHAWCKFVGELKAQQVDIPLYWFLIVKGHRTYRYLRIFSKRFYPLAAQPTPENIQLIMDHLGKLRFGADYHAGSGVVQFNQSHGYLKEEWADINQRSLEKADVKFFIQRNPDYQKGDELVCLTELTEKNLQRYALAAFRKGLNCD